MKVQLTRTLDASPSFGKITKMEFPNKSRIYVSKKGWTLVLPFSWRHLWLILKHQGEIHTILNYAEITLAIEETRRAGYEGRIYRVQR